MQTYNRLLFLIVAVSFFIGCKQSQPIENRTSAGIQHTSIDQLPDGVTKQILSANWKINKVTNAIVYKYYHFNNLFDSRQSITIIDVDLNKKVKVDIPYVTSGFLKTSEAAVNTKATAAINGSYFDTTVGGSTVFFKKEGKIITSTKDNFTPYRENAGFAIDPSGSVSIIKKPSSGWQSASVSSLLTSGPLLVYGGQIVDQLQEKFNTNRHPRTAIGVTSNNHVIAVVADGRNAEAYGMTTEELAIVMKALGCKDAMNLDGGGSSTAWVKKLGVVNYPSDNKMFDHEGERAVANVITFTSK